MENRRSGIPNLIPFSSVTLSLLLKIINSQVCALLGGGGYAEKVAVPAGQVLPIPPGVSLTDAASFPEVACTVWSTIFMTSRLSQGETLLVIHHTLNSILLLLLSSLYHPDRARIFTGSYLENV